MSNLKVEIGQYLKLFKPQTLVKAYLLTRQVEGIVINGPKKSTPSVSYSKPLFFNPKVIIANSFPAPSEGSTHALSGSKPPTKAPS